MKKKPVQKRENLLTKVAAAVTTEDKSLLAITDGFEPQSDAERIAFAWVAFLWRFTVFTPSTVTLLSLR